MNGISAKELLILISDFTEEFKVVAAKFSALDEFRETEVVTTVSKRTDSFVTYSSGLNADLASLIDNDLHCWGISYSLTWDENRWLFTGEIGYSSYSMGFDEKKGISFERDDFDLFLKDATTAFQELLTDYNSAQHESSS